MNLSLGIIGLPNAGKSTLFNAITNRSVPVENFPFTTIDPNIGIVPIKDERIDRIACIEQSEKTIYEGVRFVDIAGLVKGASKGEGLGNQFLHHIREADAIIHLIRAFRDKNITHVDATVDPKRDKQTVEAELLIKDSETVEKKLQQLKKEVKGDPSLGKKIEFLEKLLDHLHSGKPARTFQHNGKNEISDLRRDICLLSDKEVIYVINEAQEHVSTKQIELYRELLDLTKGEKLLCLDAKLELELSQLPDNQQTELLADFGLTQRPLDILIKETIDLLNLLTFFTVNKNEAHAWLLLQGSTVKEAAGMIHTDFEENFIAADVLSYESFVSAPGWLEARNKGLVHLEGKDYIVQEADVIQIRHNA